MHQKVKNLKLRWTMAWRRLHKKLETITKTKKSRVRVQKVQKAIVGITVEEIEKKKNEKPEYRQALREQSERDLKEKKRKQAESKKFMTKMNQNVKEQNKAVKKTDKQTKGAVQKNFK